MGEKKKYLNLMLDLILDFLLNWRVIVRVKVYSPNGNFKHKWRVKGHFYSACVGCVRTYIELPVRLKPLSFSESLNPSFPFLDIRLGVRFLQSSAVFLIGFIDLIPLVIGHGFSGRPTFEGPKK